MSVKESVAKISACASDLVLCFIETAPKSFFASRRTADPDS
jgi:hypothetical protein